jgi:hypothetical protein
MIVEFLKNATVMNLLLTDVSPNSWHFSKILDPTVVVIDCDQICVPPDVVGAAVIGYEVVPE